MNRKQLLAFARANGYSGAADLTALKAWFEAQKAEGTEFQFKDAGGSVVDLDTAWANVETKAFAAHDPGDTDASQQDRDGADRIKALEDQIQALKVKSNRGSGFSRVGHVNGTEDDGIGAKARMSPTGMARAAARKSYQARAYGTGPMQRKFQDADTAEAFGAWFRANHAQKWATADDLDIVGKANIGTTNTSGGALIPADFLPQLIDLKTLRGIARQILPLQPMRGDKLPVPRRTGGLTVYAPGEGGTITESNPTFDNVELNAVKMATLTHVSTELMHDSALSVGDIVAGEIAYAFADKEDAILLNGDATSTYFGFSGIRHKMLNLTATRANIAGLVVATGNDQSEFTLADYQAVAARLPDYAANAGAQWIVHREHFFGTMMRVALAAGGVTAAEIQMGTASQNYTYLGYPVRFSSVMPRVNTNDVVFALLGNYPLGCKMGEVTGSMEIATDSSVGFASDTIAIRGIQRVAILVHDVGNESGTASLRTPGPIVGLLSAAS